MIVAVIASVVVGVADTPLYFSRVPSETLTPGMALLVSSYFGIWSSFGAATVFLPLVGMWLMFVKMGESGWKSLVPFYNGYVLARRCFSTKRYWCLVALTVLLMLGGVLMFLVTVVTDLSSDEVMGRGFFYFGFLVVIWVKVQLDFTRSISEAFGHGQWCGYAMVFFPWIVLPYLGAGKGQFQEEAKFVAAERGDG